MVPFRALVRFATYAFGLGLLATSVAAQVAVSGIDAFHRDGQTFLTWNELSTPSTRYRVYRSTSPITNTGHLDQAEWLGDVDLRSSQNRARTLATGFEHNWILTEGQAPLRDNQGLYVHTIREDGPVMTGYYAVMVVQNGIEARVINNGQNTRSVSGEFAAPPRPVLQDVTNGGELWGHWTSHVDTPFQPALSTLPGHGHCFLFDSGSAPGPRGLLVRLHAAGQQYAIGWPHRNEVQSDVDILALSDLFPSGGWTLWVGNQDKYPDPTTESEAQVHLTTLRRVMWTVDWMIERIGADHDPERLYAAGGSMGGMGSFYLGSEFPERFAAILARNGNFDLTAEDINNRTFIETLLGAFDFNLTIAPGMPSSGLRVFDRFNVSVRPPFMASDPGPVIRTINGRNDTTVGWSSVPLLYDALKVAKQPAVHYFDDRVHNPFGYWEDVEAQLLNRTFRTRRDLPSLHFSGLTIDDDAGSGLFTEGDAIGCVNCYVDYDLGTAASGPEWCSFDVFLRNEGALDDARSSTAQVSLSPARTGQLELVPGDVLLFTWTEADGTELDSQFLVVDSDGRAQTEPITVSTASRRAHFERLEEPPIVPKILSFTADDASLFDGESTILRWSTVDAETLILSDGELPDVQVSGNSSFVIAPQKTTTYTLTAVGTFTTATATLTVTVEPRPVIIDWFLVYPETVRAGESVTVWWNTTNADRVSLDNGVGELSLDGAFVGFPPNTLTATLTATGPGGTATATVTVVVEQPQPKIDTFTAATPVIFEGQSTTLSWSTTDAALVTLDNGIGAVDANGSISVSPAATTTYTLTAEHSGIVTTESLTVVVEPALVSIHSFRALPTVIAPGGSSTLIWDTEHADVVTLGNGTSAGPVAADGSFLVSQSATMTYELIATGPRGTTSARVTVAVGEPEASVVVDELVATPSAILPGGTSTLSWTTTNAESVSIEGIGDVPLAGSAIVQPSETTTYNLTAVGLDGSVQTMPITVEVQITSIDSFAPESYTLIEGESQQIHWTTSYADEVRLNLGIGEVALNGSRTISPPVTRTYILTATGPSGEVTESFTVTVFPAPPEVTNFDVTPGTIIEGSTATLAWSTDKADTVVIDNGIGSVDTTGSLDVSPLVTTSYTLTATGPGGTETSTITLTVVPPAPEIPSFTASTLSIFEGEETTLSWSTLHADTIVIDSGVGDVAASGSVTLTPTATTTYTLTASGRGGTETASLTVVVAPPLDLPIVDAFQATPDIIAPGETSTLTWGTTNADTVMLDNGTSMLTVGRNGGFTVSPEETTTFTLIATNGDGSVVGETTLTIVVPPVIDNFVASLTEIDEGGTSVLSWATSDADTVTLEPGIGAVALDGSVSIAPATTTTYTLTASSALESTTQTITVVVRPTLAPDLSYQLSGVPATIDRNDFFSVTLAVTNSGNADSEALTVTLAFSGDGELGTNDVLTKTSQPVQPGQTANVVWSVRARSAGTGTVTVTVSDSSGALRTLSDSVQID